MNKGHINIFLVFFCIIASIVAVMGWTRAAKTRDARKDLIECNAKLSNCRDDLAVSKPEGPSAKIKNLQDVKSTADVKISSNDNPAVKKLIENKAKALADKIAQGRVDDFLNQEKSKRAKQFHTAIDTMEKGMVNAANRFLEDKKFSESDGKKLHSLIETAFETHRNNFERWQNGEITEEEGRKLGQAVNRKSREDAVAILGEDQAQEFLKYIQEEMKKAFEQQQAENAKTRESKSDQ
ncbi:hypothetical protein KKF34_17360 [Myxococcota bacterium]|nr:hypothetical protein [Myxococcota bacterium]MBU1382970.1 hypothetical protein [Myxococcota bacterium]MBU1498650.1 hypothetical protein [Myxococcota bacterium]